MMHDFIHELRRRRVFRVAAAFAVAAFVTAQVADIFFPGVGLPAWSLRLVLVLPIIGFPVSLVPAHLRLGEIHDRLGDAARAVQHYARFTAAWKHCDADLQPLRGQAEQRLVALLADSPASAASRS